MVEEFKDDSEQILEKREWKDAQEYWSAVMDLAEKNEPHQVEDLLLKERTDYSKMPGEDELYVWLESHLGRKPLVELNEKRVLVPIEKKKEAPENEAL